eukprot:5195902-Prorocentrum_lima.AAC.1
MFSLAVEVSPMWEMKMCSCSSVSPFVSSLAGGGEGRGGVTRHSVPNSVGKGEEELWLAST